MLTDDDSVIVLADNMATSNYARGRGGIVITTLYIKPEKKQYIVLARVQVK